MRLLIAGFMAVVLVVANPSIANGDDSQLTLDRIFKDNEFRTDWFGGAVWRSGKTYSLIEESDDYPDAYDIVEYNAETGARQVLVAAANLIPEGEENPIAVSDVQWSEDGSLALIYTNTKRVWRYNTQGDYWVLNLKDGALRQLGADFEESSLMFAKFSPDATRVAYVQKQDGTIHDIYVEELDTGALTRLTTDGSRTTFNGTFDWAYEEEFGLRDGFRWSPDGSKIAYWQIDASGVKDFTLINNTDATYPTLTTFSYPKVGEVISGARIGVVDAAGGDTRWMDIPLDPRDHYLVFMEWAANSDEILVQQLNRRQNTNRVYLTSASSGDATEILVDKDGAWLDPVTDLTWMPDGSEFLFVSEREGWRQIYRVSRDGSSQRKITPGSYDVISISRIDLESGFIYFLGSIGDPQRRYLYRVSIEGGDPELLTPMAQKGWHSYSVSTDGTFAFNNWSNRALPTQIELVSLPDHAAVQTFVDNAELQSKLAELELGQEEFFTVGMDDGVRLEGVMRFPPDFDPSKKYPVLFFVYGEPAGMTAADRWSGSRGMWHRMMTQKGYIFVTLDNRGQPAAKGREWRKSLYRTVGITNVDDQAEAARKLLARHDFMDSDRVGIWGHSGGGTSTLHALFRHGDVFKVGVSRAPVADIKLYDAIYQERYSGVLPDDAAYYKNAAALTHADGLTGKLLLVHGTGDDNVHYQGSEMLVNKLVEAGKQFSFFAYPNRTHGIREGQGTTLHLMTMQTNFFDQHMGGGPR